METKLTDGAVKDRKELSEAQWQEIRSKIEEISNSLSHKDLKLVENPFLKHPVWQLIVEETETDHRVYIDVANSKMIVLAIWDFEFTHQGDEHWRELEDRI